MTPTVPHILMTVHGQMPGGELWTCGLRTYRASTFLSTTSGQLLANAVATRWLTFRNDAGIGSLLFASAPGSCATVDGVTVREINDEGAGVTQYEGLPTGTNTVGAFKAGMPNQATLVVSLLTARAGRTGKGRIYLPALGFNSGGALEAGQVTVSIIGTIADSVKTLFDGINTDLATHFGAVLRLAVQSPTSAQKWFDDNSLADYNGAELTGFKIGNTIDTQRRRRASLVETYVSRAVA